jgi:hypothetical protein
LKKGLTVKHLILQLIQRLAIAVFIGISVYGIFIYYGGEIQKRIPGKTALLLGFTAVLCVVVIVVLGGIIDRQASMRDKRD